MAGPSAHVSHGYRRSHAPLSLRGEVRPRRLFRLTNGVDRFPTRPPRALQILHLLRRSRNCAVLLRRRFLDASSRRYAISQRVSQHPIGAAPSMTVPSDRLVGSVPSRPRPWTDYFRSASVTASSGYSPRRLEVPRTCAVGFRCRAGMQQRTGRTKAEAFAPARTL